MKLTIAPTEHFFMASEVMVRMWQGTAEDGSEVVAFVATVGFGGLAEALSEGLVSIPPPDAEAQVRWANSVLGSMPGNIGC